MATTETDVPETDLIAENLKHVRNRLLVFSGKGGVGKTTVAVNIAAGLAREGRRVGLLDVDIHGPNVPKMLGIEDERPGPSPAGRISPVRAPGGVAVISMAMFIADRSAPVVWRGPLKMRAITQFLSEVDWGELDWLVIDSPPGTGDEPLSVAQLIPTTAAVIVTTPQAVAILDSRKAVNFAQLLKLRVLGVVENMSSFVCPHCGKEIPLFGRGGGAAMAREMLVPLLGQIPLDPTIVEGGDTGRPFVTECPESPAAKAMMEVVARIMKLEEE
ncbi:MAG: Mrp/NBP35 family ATP-binding protein [candidate division WOR-3 bacterium]